MSFGDNTIIFPLSFDIVLVSAERKLRYTVLAILYGCLQSLSFSVFAGTDLGNKELKVDDVLASADLHFPRILEGMAERRAAEARALAAQGAFDLLFNVEGLGWADGFYDGRSVEARASRGLRDYGAEVYGGYQLSNGNFPVYEDKRFTNSGGQLELGVLFSLLRDRDIDARRFKESDTRLATREADLELLLTRIGVAQQSIISYWRWVALGQKLRVYKSLLEIAMVRQEALEQEVRRGARPEIVLTENLQNITRRKSLLATAQRDVAVAANELSLYYRDEQGNTVVVKQNQLPDYKPMHMGADTVYDVPVIDQTFDERPELLSLRNTINRTIRKIELNQNELLPQLDLKLELAQPLGSVAEGGISRDETDVVVGLQFSVPLEQRAARGALAESEAKLSSLRQKERMLQDRIQLEVTNILVNLKTSQELLDLANQEVIQSERLREAELKRFQQGASDFFLVNVREQAAAEARIRYYLAGMQREIAQTNFDAATVNLSRLGIRSY